MINYLRGTDAGIEPVYQAFTIGFSDYSVKQEISMTMFKERFFGPEGNSLQHSYAAFDGNKPVGVVLGGIRQFDGIKTMRCGAMSVHPEYRRRGIGKELMTFHRKEAVAQGCRQLFLEVITDNDKAVALYKKLGYVKVYDLEYFTLEDTEPLGKSGMENTNIKPAGLEELLQARRRIGDVHINWQNDIGYIEKMGDWSCYGTFDGGRLTGLLCLQDSGRVKLLWVDAAYRRQGIGRSLLKKAISGQGLTKMSLSMSNNALLRGFASGMGFKKDALSQYEMYHFLDGEEIK